MRFTQLRSFRSAWLTASVVFLSICRLSAQPYPCSSYKLSEDGTILVKWLGSETCIDMTADPKLSRVQIIGDGAFNLKDSLTSITLPLSLISIQEYAFNMCSNLKSVVFSPALETIGDRSFFLCSKLTDIDLPNSITTIGASAFHFCLDLTRVDLPKSLTKIGRMAFYWTGLTSVTLPESLKLIEESAFAMCPIQEVESYALVPPEAKIYFFHWHTLKTAPLRVPEKSLHAYKTTEPWSEFKTIEPLPASSLSDLAASLFEVYPIPAKGTLKVEVAEEFIGKTVYLYNMTGKLLLEIVLNSLRTSIDVSFLPSGIYLLKTDKALKKVAIH